MLLFDDDRIPTPEECIKEFTIKSQLKQLEEEYAQRKSDVEILRSIEQNLRKSIVQLSNTLSQLYQRSGSLAQIGIPQEQEQN
jgi:hypothetical protein